LTHKAYNSVIQGGAADVVEDRMLAVADAGLPADMLLQIHDELVFEIEEALAPVVVPEIQSIMVDLPQFDVKFATEAKVWSKV
jgi:DNA polymerase-1